MANWDMNVWVSVLAAAAGVDVKGFRLLCWMTEDVTFPELYRLFDSNPAAQADSTLGTDAKAACADFFSQKKRPRTIMIGKKAADAAQSLNFEIGGVWAEGDIARISVTPFLGSEITGEYTCLSSPTLEDVAAGLRADLTTKLSGEAIAVGGATVNCSLTSSIAGQPFAAVVGTLSTDAGTITRTVLQENVNFATCLTALLLSKRDWFGLAIDSRAPADIWWVSEWAEANKKLFICQNDETNVRDWVADNIYDKIESASRRFTWPCWHHDDAERFDLAWLTDFLSHDPDKTSTIAGYRPLVNVTANPESDINDTARILLAETHNVSLYLPFHGVPVGFPGKVADGSKVDATLAYCWLEARICEALAQLQLDVVAGNSKISFDDEGITLIANTIGPVLARGETVKHIRKNTSVVEVPLFKDVSSADVEARLLKLSGSCQLAGAIEKTEFTLSVELAA